MPSPPLFPAPHSTAAVHRPGRSGSKSRAASATALAARSIRSMEGMPRSMMAVRSSSFIWADVVNFIGGTSVFSAVPIIKNRGFLCNPRFQAKLGGMGIFLLHFPVFCAISVNCISDERENDRETPPREGRSPAASRPAERPAWFAREPPWRHGRVPSVTGASSARGASARIWVVPRKPCLSSQWGRRVFLLSGRPFPSHLKSAIKELTGI